MSRIVENLLRNGRACVVGRRAGFSMEGFQSSHLECATGDDRGAPEAQRVFHKERFGLTHCGLNARTPEVGLVNKETPHFNTTAGDGIDLYLIGSEARGLGV